MHRDYFASGVIAVSLIVNMLIAWTVVLAPSHAAPLLYSAGMNGADHADSAISNTSRKGARLTVLGNKIEHSAIPEPKKVARKIPVGCEIAFGNRVRSDKIAMRWIT